MYFNNNEGGFYIGKFRSLRIFILFTMLGLAVELFRSSFNNLASKFKKKQ